MSDRPDDDGAMFFVGMKFSPDESLRQADLNRLTPYLLRLLFHNHEDEPMPVKEMEPTILMLVQFLVDLDIRLDEEAFAQIPEDLRKHFMVLHRDGVKYRYGRKPRMI